MAKDPGKTLRTAQPFPISATRKTQTQRLSANDQLDLWKITPSLRSSLNLSLNGLARRANADLAVLNASGRVISSSARRGNKAETVSNLLLEPGTFYIRVKLNKNSADTRYRLSLQATPSSDQAGNSFTEASSLPASGTLTDFVGNSDPADFFGFSTRIAGRFNVSLTGLSDDAQIELYDGQQNLLFASTNSGTATETINQRLIGIAGSDYFLKVSPAPGKDAGYTLSYGFTADPLIRTSSGLQYTDITTGTGPTPQKGQTVTVQYTGILTNGFKFDSSRDRNQSFQFKIGEGEVIKGWDEGISTMTVGSRRQLVIPAQLAYGSTGSGSIPPNATLIFDVEVLKIE
jgi:hypothetical protein